MKNKRLLFLFITLLTLAQGAWADDPEWLKSGDSWDEATKTLTVNSNPVNNAYQNNTDIEHVIVSDNVENIGSRAFDSCTKLKTIVIGNGVKNINRDAFENCTSLKTIIMTRTSSAPSINGTPFYPNFDLKIYVPMDSNGNILEDYTKGDWRAYLLVNMLVGSWRSGTCAVTYKNNVLTVVGWGAMADDIPSYRGWNRHCSDVTSVVIEDGVTHIGGDAFLGCRNLASVTIPASVTSIGSGAFSDCSSLPSINISANVQSIGSGAFSGCNSLATITVDEDNQTFDSRGDCNAIIRKEGNELVAGCKNTTIPEDVQSIGERAFYGCGSLTSITIPASVTSIGGQAFYICGLTAITIPNSVQSIGDNAFFWCSNLESVSIGSGVESISPNTFNRCHNLRTITIDANNPTFDSRDGCNAIIRKSDDELVVGCYATIIPNSVKSIGDMAFMQTALQAITIPASVQSIGSTAFLSCSNLKTVTIYATSVPTLGESVFDGNKSGRKFYVFSDRVEAYKAAWGMNDDIEAIGGTCGKTNSDNVTWELAGELGNCTLIISGTGAMADYSAGYQPWAAYQSGINKVIIGSGVTEVKPAAFANCSADLIVIVPPAEYDSYYNDEDWSSYQSKLKKNFATCTASVPDQALYDGVYTYSYIGYKFDDHPETIGEDVKAGETTLTRGTDYYFGSVTFASDGASYTDRTNQIGDVFNVEIIGDGDYVGTKTVSFTLVGPNGIWGDLAWSLADNGTLSITGTGAMNNAVNYNGYDFPWINCRDDITAVVIGEGVTSVADKAFGAHTGEEKYSNVTSVTLPSTLTSIGSYAFDGCGITSINIPAGGTSIGNGAFVSCTSLSSVTLNGGATIGSDAFPLAATVTIADGLCLYNGTEGLSGEITDMDKLNGKTLKVALQITLPASVTATGTGVFTQADGTYAVPGATVTLAAPAGYNLSDVSSSEVTITETEGVYSFTMPTSDVTVTATLTTIPWSGTGTEDDPWVIEYPSQLDLLAQRVNSRTGDDYAASGYYEKYFILGTDITYSHTTEWDDASSTENNYTPIGGYFGNKQPVFQGTFDGKGHTVSGIRIYKDGNSISDGLQSLFGWVFEASSVIRGITLADTRITGYGYVGGIVGYNQSGTISDCHVAANVVLNAVQDEAYSFGGIVGCNGLDENTVSNCTSAATLTKTGSINIYEFGGIVGGNAGTMSHNLAIGVVVPAATENSHGAICGVKGGTLENNYYYGCTVAGVENATGVGCGHIKVKYDYTTADVTTNNGAVPGIILYDNSSRTDLNSYILTTVGNNAAVSRVALSDRTLYKDGDWNTLCLPFSLADLTGTPLEGATVKELDVDGTYDTDKKTGFDDGTLYLYFKDATAIEAGKPYLVKWDKAADYDDDPSKYDITAPVFTGVTISSTTPGSVNSEGNLVQFKGIYNPTKIYSAANDNLFLGAGNTLYWPSTEDYTLNACRAYFHVNLSGELQVREIRLNLGDEVTDVQSVCGKRLAVSEVNGSMPVKRIVNGRLILERNGKLFNANGSRIVISV